MGLLGNVTALLLLLGLVGELTRGPFERLSKHPSAADAPKDLGKGKTEA
jgi:hypothetical protein